MTWKYQELLNQNLQILFTLAFGALSAHLRIFTQDDLKVFTDFIFDVLLPSSIISFLGIRSNLRDGTIWKFIASFIMLRAMLLVPVILVFYRRGVGVVAANWLFISWISSIVLGIPLARAALGPQYANLGVLAGVSSLIFQLPVLLFMFESHMAGEKQKLLLSGAGSLPPDSAAPAISTTNNNNTTTDSTTENEYVDNEQLSTNNNTHDAESGRALPSVAKPTPPSIPTTTTPPTTTRPRSSVINRNTSATDAGAPDMRRIPIIQLARVPTMRRKSVTLQFLRNPLLWSIFAGIIMSVTTLGPRYLNPGNPPSSPNCDYVPETGFIYNFFASFAACTEPVALFATGIFLYGMNPFSIGWFKICSYMLTKLVLVPAIAIGCAFAVGLEGATGRGAVLLSGLPIASAAFAMSSRYGLCPKEAMANVFWGMLLLLPTTLGWMAFMDSINLFVAAPPPSTNVCSSPPPAPTATTG